VVAAVLLVTELVARLLLPATAIRATGFLEVVGGPADARLSVRPDAPLRGGSFRDGSWKLLKSDGWVRVACLGDSTAHGHPFDPPAPYANWLQERLPGLLPGRRFEVLNFGVNGMNAEAVADLAAELAPLAPDLVLIYVGHNEFLDQHLAASLAPLGHFFARLLRDSAAWRLARGSPAATGGDAELSAELRRRGALDAVALLPEEALDRGIRRYRAELERAARALTTCGAKVAFIVPICDLKDTPPQRSTLPPELSGSARAELESLLARSDATAAELEAAAKRHGDFAALDYARGRALLRDGDRERARACLEAAIDRDGHPIRATRRMRDALREAAAATGASVIDPWPALLASAPDLPGQDGWFVDYVHPDLRGHEFLADVLLRALADAGWCEPRAAWRFDLEPDSAALRARMGLTEAAQAASLARRGLFALGQAYLDPGSELLAGAADAFARAQKLDPDCAAAFAGQGALHLLRGERDPALAAFRRAHQVDPEALAFLRSAHDANPEVAALFERAGLALRDGQVTLREER
jgi:lysophospholipase L1-like esterase